MQGANGVVLLALAAVGLPLLLFEYSLRRHRHRSQPRLILDIEPTPACIRLRWAAVDVSPRRFGHYEIVRESDDAKGRCTWVVAEFDQTGIDDWAVDPGRTYRYVVLLVMQARRGRYDVLSANGMATALTPT